MLRLFQCFLTSQMGTETFIGAVEPVECDRLAEAGRAGHVVIIVLFGRRQPRETIAAVVFDTSQVNDGVPHP